MHAAGVPPASQPGEDRSAAESSALAKAAPPTIMDGLLSRRRAADRNSEHADEAMDHAPGAAEDEQGKSWAAAAHPADAAASKSRAEEAFAAASVLLAGSSYLAQTSAIEMETGPRQESGLAKQAYDPIVWQLPESSRHVWEARVGPAGDPGMGPAEQRAAQARTAPPLAERPTPQILWEARITKAALQQPPGSEGLRQEGRISSTRRSGTLPGYSGRPAQGALRTTEAGSAPLLPEPGGLAEPPAGSAEVRPRASHLQLLQARMADRHAARRGLSSVNMTGMAGGETPAGSDMPAPGMAASLPAIVPILPTPQNPAGSSSLRKAPRRRKSAGVTGRSSSMPSSSGHVLLAGGEMADLEVCGTCGRSFHAAALEKHSRICTKA